MRSNNRSVVGWIASLALVLCGFAASGCSQDDTGGGEAGESGGSSGSGTATGTVSDAYGGTNDGTASGGSGDASTDPYAGGVCNKRSKYLKLYKPNVYFTVDTSGSMEGTKWTQATNGLDTVADSIAGDLRVGLSAFPQKSAGCSSFEFLDLGEHGAGEIKNSYASIEPAGGTPTGVALYQVRRGGWLDDSGDAYDASRPKGLILITDGQPNDQKVCDGPQQTVRDPVEQARKLANKGVSVYVVGFKSEADPKTLNQLARAGGTNAPGSERFYSASNASELSNTLLNITGTAVSCSFSLNPAPPSGSTVNVTLSGETVPNSGYNYEESRARVTLEGSWCDKLRTRSKQGTTLNIDIGCPDCALAGESCESASDCCDGTCENGVCKEQCRSFGQTCSSDGECCSGTCATTGEEELLGQCSSG